MLDVQTDPRQTPAAANDPGHVAAGLQACPPDVLDLVLWHEHQIGQLLSSIDEHEQMLAVELRPALAARREEIARATGRLALIREHEAGRARVEALTSSWSWRATAPARRLYGWYLALTSCPRGDRS